MSVMIRASASASRARARSTGAVVGVADDGDCGFVCGDLVAEGFEVFPGGLLGAALGDQGSEDGVDELGDAGRGAEVLGELGQSCLLVALDLVELADVGAAEAVDRLLGVADEEGASGFVLGDGVDDSGSGAGRCPGTRRSGGG